VRNVSASERRPVFVLTLDLSRFETKEKAENS
jgi:hypothetical protein